MFIFSQTSDNYEILLNCAELLNAREIPDILCGVNFIILPYKSAIISDEGGNL